MPRLVAYKFGLLDNGTAKEALFGSYFSGMPAIAFQRAGMKFIPEIDKMLRPDIMDALHAHARAGHTIYIVSASMPQWIEPWAASHDVTKVIGTEPAIDCGGLLTGKFATPNCYGAEKVRRFLTEEPDRKGYILVVYGDSQGDREMLAEADEPHLV